MPDLWPRISENKELFRLFLLHLDLPTLLVSAPRVCKHWYHTIVSSPRIQEALFKRPVVVPRGRTSVQPDQNPFIWQRGWFLHALFRISDDDFDDLREATTRGLPYPVHVPSSPSSIVDLDFLLFEIQDSLYGRPAFSRRGASWRQLLLQQPPIVSFGQVICRWNPRGWYQIDSGIAECSGGLRFGHLWDTLRDQLGHLKDISSCRLRLAWWEPSVTTFDMRQWPMADEMVELFDRGAQLVLLIGYSDPDEEEGEGKTHGPVCGAPHGSPLLRCEEYEPLPFQMTKHPPFTVNHGRRIPLRDMRNDWGE